MEWILSSIPRGMHLLPISVAIYLMCCVTATLHLYETGSNELFWPAHLIFAVLFAVNLVQRGTFGVLFAGIVRAGPVFVSLFAFMAYFLIRCLLTSYEQLGIYYAKLGLSSLGLGILLGFCVIYPLVSSVQSGRTARFGLVILVLGLSLITVYLGSNLRQDIFLIDLAPKNASYYQIFGDYQVMLFCCCVLFVNSAELGNSKPIVGFVARQSCSSLLAIWSVLIAQGAGSNNAASSITLMSALYFVFDAVNVWRGSHGVRRLQSIAVSITMAAVIAAMVGALILRLPPLRIFNFLPVNLPGSVPVSTHVIGKPGGELELPTSVIARAVDFHFFWQQFHIDPIWGHLGAEWVIGKPGLFPHTLLSVQSHLGAIGSVLLMTFLGLALMRLIIHRSDKSVLAVTVALFVIAMTATFFTWMPFWFVAGLLLGMAALHRPRAASGTHLHVSMTPFRNESRVLKETWAIREEGVAQRVVILALHEDGLPLREDIGGDRVLHRIALRSRHLPTNLMAQALKYLELGWAVYRRARLENIDVISVHTVALLPIGALVKASMGARLVYDAHELETETHGRTALRRTLARIVERRFIGAVDLTVVVSPSIESWYRNAYKMQSIVTVLNAPNFQNRARSNRIRELTGIDARQRILLYQGALGTGRGIDRLLSAAPRLADFGYELVFMGYGELQSEIERFAAQTNNVHFLPAVLPAEILAYTMSADVGLCSIEDSCLSYRLSLPNKLFEYLFAGLPVIASDLPEMARIVQQYRVGAVVRSWQVEDILAALVAIDALRDGDFLARLDDVVAHYNWDCQKARMIFGYQSFVPIISTNGPIVG